MEQSMISQQEIYDWLASSATPECAPDHPDVVKQSPASFPAAPATPPTSTPSQEQDEEATILDALAVTPSGKRRPRPDDDETPRSRLDSRPVLRYTSPSERPRNTSPTAIKSIAHLAYLEKPVLIVGAETGFSRLPVDVKDLFRSIRRVNQHSEFIPGEVQAQVTALLSNSGTDARGGWFIPAGNRGKEDALHELGQVVAIGQKAARSLQLGRHEAAWNSAVHHPLLELAFETHTQDEQDRPPPACTRVENVTSATISGDCVPRLGRQEEDSVSVGAYSVCQSSAGSSTSHEDESYVPPGPLPLDGTVSSRAGSKKVDFAIVVDPEPGTSFYAATQTVLDQLTRTPWLSTSINPSSYSPLVSSPAAIVVETKTVAASRDPIVQLGLMAVAFHRRLHTLPVPRATGGNLITKTGELVTLPLIAVTDHRWELLLACDQGDKIELVGPLELGSTVSLASTYMLLTSLRLLKTWVLSVFCPALERYLTLPRDA